MTTIGDRIRDRRLRRGWSVRHAADRAGISHASWSRIERGRQAADNRFVLADIAAALECAPADLAGEPVPAADRAAAAAHGRVHAIRQALVDVDLSEPPARRARADAGPAPVDAHQAPNPAADGIGPAIGLAADDAGPATGPAADDADPAARRVPPIEALARTAALVDRLRRSCDYAGAGRLLPDLLRDAHAATTGPDRPAALRLLCEAAFGATGVVRNLGHAADAWLAAERCRDAAEASEDPVLRGYAAYARSTAAAACGSYARALSLVIRAADDVRPHTGRPGGAEVLGMLCLMGAYAARGDKRPDDCRTWLGEAAALAGRTGESDAMGLFFGPTNVGIWRIGMEADGGDPGRAVHIARSTDPAVIAAGCRQVFYYADTARALARIGGHDREAIRSLLVAERLAPQHVHSSAVARETTRALLERSRRQAAGAELRGLSARMDVT